MTFPSLEILGRDAPQPCRDLWSMVLLRGLADAITPNPTEPNRRSGSRVSQSDQADARRWVGSPGFHQVCALAGIDAEAVLEWYGRVMSQADSARAAALFALTGSVGDSRRGNGRQSRKLAA